MSTSTQLNTIVAQYAAAYKAKQMAITSFKDALTNAGIVLDRKALNQPCMVAIAAAYGVALVAKVRGEGFTWSDDKVSLAAKQCHKTLLGDLFAGETKHSDALEVPEAIQAAANKLVAMCKEYEQMGKLIATAIANAKAA
jgi:hypothetical protein